MKTFIKATEIWEPNREKTALTLVSGAYGTFKEFESYSQKLSFTYNEGLPGHAWAEKKPIILKDIVGSYFQRTEMASKIGITTAIALPIFAGEYLHAVVVFLCGDDTALAGAIEIWEKDPERRNEMGLVEGYYGTMQEFEWISRNVKIMRNHGLPGTVWATSMPYIIKNLGDSATFLRARKAVQEGITTALALPAWMHEDDAQVVTFLSAKGTPIARRFEIWIPDETGEALIYRDGFCDAGTSLDTLYQLTRFSKDTSTLGGVYKTGYPILTHNYTTIDDDIHFDTLLAIPIIQNGFCNAVVAFYN